MVAEWLNPEEKEGKGRIAGYGSLYEPDWQHRPTLLKRCCPMTFSFYLSNLTLITALQFFPGCERHTQQVSWRGGRIPHSTTIGTDRPTQ